MVSSWSLNSLLKQANQDLCMPKLQFKYYFSRQIFFFIFQGNSKFKIIQHL